ncbi:uncharacterized protein LOC111382363 [Olea europaea var. sylvestris]|uniref:uncharacterized protein LOC111382363 n=1 Tax=Olea europaea var. sylvestris TaxID=158386 RepID=UPI000C1D4557|nr:uncharacterized protein LOC111382363 [Olea europaea var. sylvestris]
MSDKDPRFTSKFWRSLQTAMGTKLSFNLGDKWEKHLPLVEFAYNNSFQATIDVIPYEALYGRRCHSPICWDEVDEKRILGPELIKNTVEAIDRIRMRIKISQDRQKSYADKRRKELGFEVGEKVGNVAYHLALPPELSAMHDVFHISMLRKYIHDPSHVVNAQSLGVWSDMTYEEVPIRVIERKVRTLRNREVPLVKVQWSRHGKDEATWEREADILAKYPDLLIE